MMNGIDTNPIPVGPQPATITGRLARVAANLLALTIVLIVAPGIKTLAKAVTESRKVRLMYKEEKTNNNAHFVLCHKRVSAVATKVAISRELCFFINEDVAGDLGSS